MSAQQQTWSERLWDEIEPTFAAILAHPFATGLADGTLDTDVFAHYVAQDVHYLRDYARALAIVGAKAPTLTDTAMFARHAADVLEVELSLHGTLLPALGLDGATVGGARVMPTTRAYTSYLLATTYGGSFAEGLAAILPCYWIYARVGTALLESGSPDPRFQSWIDSYGGEDFAATVAQVLELTDRIGRALSPAEEVVARAHFVTTARYEWMFFDAAYRLEDWPV
jgi:thiaminase/transcriptional activator TenA